MRFLIGCAICLAFTASAVGAAEPKPGRTYLASLTGIKLSNDEGLMKFKYDTWGVEVIAVCHIPSGWTVTAGKSADPSGELAGRASLGATFVQPGHLNDLRGLFLIRFEGPLDRKVVKNTGGERPATFSGTAQIWRYGGDDDDGRPRPIGIDSLRFTRADRCPKPRR